MHAQCKTQALWFLAQLAILSFRAHNSVNLVINMVSKSKLSSSLLNIYIHIYKVERIKECSKLDEKTTLLL